MGNVNFPEDQLQHHNFQIMRGDLEGSHQEPLPILTTAKELRIDAENAFIYWSTGHAVESARLNGEARRVYYPAQLFSGKQGNVESDELSSITL